MDDKLKKAIEEGKEFDGKCGEVLRLALSIEHSLEFFIANYFIRPQNGKTFFFEDELLVNMQFFRKIDLFEKICKREKFNQEKISEALGLIRYVNKFRNKVAHWEAEKSGSDSPIRLRRKAQTTTIKDIWEINDKNLEEFKRKQAKSNKMITNFYLEYSRNGTIDEKPGHFE
jgi:transcriptional regulator with XRE-family HTH domain